MSRWRLDVVAERTEPTVPLSADVVQPAHRILEQIRVNLVTDLVPVAMAGDDAGARQGREMLDDRLTGRATESFEIPTLRASDRVVQCVEVSSGFSFTVTRTTSATFPSASHGLRPRPSAITPTPPTPSRAKAARHERTVFALTPTRRPISSLGRPSAAPSSPLAWRTAR